MTAKDIKDIESLAQKDTSLKNRTTAINKPNKPCHICGSNDWWQNFSGAWVCNICHPNPLTYEKNVKQ